MDGDIIQLIVGGVGFVIGLIIAIVYINPLVIPDIPEGLEPLIWVINILVGLAFASLFVAVCEAFDRLFWLNFFLRQKVKGHETNYCENGRWVGTGLIAKVLGGIIIFAGIIDMSHLLLVALSSTTYTFAYMLGYNTIEFLIAGGASIYQ